MSSKNRKSHRHSPINIVMPMAGAGTSFTQAGYTFPKPLVDVNGKPMIQVVIENLKPKLSHKFIFLAQKEHFEKYSLHEILKNSVKEEFEVIQLSKLPQGAACTVLAAIEFINNDSELIIVNSDQVIDVKLDDFIAFARKSKADGVIMTFESGHPRWSYVRLNKKGEVI
ncbi:MAG: NTP transferase domain-containing protein, partial [Patescibacteria group bacterium]|nr:NTP transferase domain-containing protein [Patescibacteria group bacterium]